MKHFFPVEPTLGPNIPVLQVKQLFLDGVLNRNVPLIGSYRNLAIAITGHVQILAYNFIQNEVNATESSALLDTILISNTAELEINHLGLI